MKKSVVIMYIAVFLLLFVAPAIVFTVIGPYITQENYEQRKLTEKPEFEIATIDSYPKRYEEYYNDHLPFRNQLIKANSLINHYIFRTGSVSKVIEGQDGWLFYNPGGMDGDNIADYNGKNLFTDDALRQIADNMLNARDVLKTQNRELVIMIIPNKESMYGDSYLPENYRSDNDCTTAEQVAAYLTEHTDLSIVFPKKELENAEDRYPHWDLYCKLDTHWNNLGAYIGARSLLRELNITLPDLDTLSIEQYGGQSGDLANMMGMADYLNYDVNYNIEGYPVGKNITGEGEENITHYTSSGMDPRKVFVIRDSFSVAMAPYICSQFDECYMVHRDYYTPQLIEEQQPDVVIYQVVERYLSDSLDFSVE